MGTTKTPTDMIFEFQAKKLPGAFNKKITRSAVAGGLLQRIKNPWKIDQEGSSLCGPTALVYNLARTAPSRYVQFVIDLYEHGHASLGKLFVKAGQDLLSYDPGHEIHPADWIPLASIRDSQNAYFDYQAVSDKAAGITTPKDLATWFRKVGYQFVEADASLLKSKGPESVMKANALISNNYKVSLLINMKILGENYFQSALKTRACRRCPPRLRSIEEGLPDHWVVLLSRVLVSTGNVRFKIFTWGKELTIPQKGDLKGRDFLYHYFGYVACKF